MKSVLTFIFLSCCAAASFAQKDEKFIVIGKVSPLALIDPNTPVLQPGLEFRFGSRFGIQGEYGLGIGFLSEEITPRKINHRYSKWRSELRYYILNKKRATQKGTDLIALEIFAVQQQYQKRNNRFTDDKTKQELSFDTASVSRQTQGLCLKFGNQFSISKNKRMLLEVAGGAGVRKVQISYTDVTNLRLFEPGLFTINGIKPNDWYNGTRHKVHLAAMVKFGYRLF